MIRGDSYRYADYLIEISPLVFAQLLIPPLSYFVGERVNIPYLQELYEYLTPKQFFSLKYLRSLMFDSKNYQDDRFFTMISYMFIHGDYQHLLNNLQSLITVSYPVYTEFGSLGLYSIFFGSGIAAILPTSLRETQRNGGNNRPFYEKFWRSLGTFVFNPKCCGSSGAVFGLFGSSQVLLFFRFIRYLHDLKVSIRSELTSSRTRALHSRGIFDVIIRKIDFKYALISLIQISSAISTIKYQIDLANEGGEGNIDNAGHVQGFLGGIAITGVLQFVKLFLHRR